MNSSELVVNMNQESRYTTVKENFTSHATYDYHGRRGEYDHGRRGEMNQWAIKTVKSHGHQSEESKKNEEAVVSGDLGGPKENRTKSAQRALFQGLGKKVNRQLSPNSSPQVYHNVHHESKGAMIDDDGMVQKKLGIDVRDLILQQHGFSTTDPVNTTSHPDSRSGNVKKTSPTFTPISNYSSTYPDGLKYPGGVKSKVSAYPDVTHILQGNNDSRSTIMKFKDQNPFFNNSNFGNMGKTYQLPQNYQFLGNFDDNFSQLNKKLEYTKVEKTFLTLATGKTNSQALGTKEANRIRMKGRMADPIVSPDQTSYSIKGVLSIGLDVEEPSSPVVLGMGHNMGLGVEEPSSPSEDSCDSEYTNPDDHIGCDSPVANLSDFRNRFEINSRPLLRRQKVWQALDRAGGTHGLHDSSLVSVPASKLSHPMRTTQASSAQSHYQFQALNPTVTTDKMRSDEWNFKLQERMLKKSPQAETTTEVLSHSMVKTEMKSETRMATATCPVMLPATINDSKLGHVLEIKPLAECYSMYRDGINLELGATEEVVGDDYVDVDELQPSFPPLQHQEVQEYMDPDLINYHTTIKRKGQVEALSYSDLSSPSEDKTLKDISSVCPLTNLASQSTSSSTDSNIEETSTCSSDTWSDIESLSSTTSGAPCSSPGVLSSTSGATCWSPCTLSSSSSLVSVSPCRRSPMGWSNLTYRIQSPGLRVTSPGSSNEPMFTALKQEKSIESPGNSTVMTFGQWGINFSSINHAKRPETSPPWQNMQHLQLHRVQASSHPQEPGLKRPKNGFIRYAMQHRRQVAALHPSLDNREISRILGSQWKGLTRHQKHAYESAFQEEMTERRKEHPEWKYGGGRVGPSCVQEPIPSRLRPRDKLKKKRDHMFAPQKLTRVYNKRKPTVIKISWVQCDRCSEWRQLPQWVKKKDLPEKWYCEYNIPPDNKCNYMRIPEKDLDG